MEAYSYTSHLSHKALRYLQWNKSIRITSWFLNFSCITSNFGCRFYQYFIKLCRTLYKSKLRSISYESLQLYLLFEL